jgi:FSR family fosmidomycin resistance protein-like MFS transporter
LADLENFYYYVVLYNILAFGLQLPIGWLIDLVKKPVVSSVAGCLLLIVAMCSGSHSLFAVITAGVGNALFHVGGGSIALNLQPKKALFPGIFVAPGGIGLASGIFMAKNHYFAGWYFIMLLVLSCITIISLRIPSMNYQKEKITAWGNSIAVAVLLVMVIIVRSSVGLSVNFPWKSNLVLLIILTLGVALGKASGGFFGDKFGWNRIAAGGLLLSAPILAFGAANPVTGLLGILLFNLSMPISLVAISNLFAGRPGLSFGLTTGALLMGALPTFSAYKGIISRPHFVLPLVLASSSALFIGLKIYLKMMSESAKATGSQPGMREQEPGKK